MCVCVCQPSKRYLQSLVTHAGMLVSICMLNSKCLKVHVDIICFQILTNVIDYTLLQLVSFIILNYLKEMCEHEITSTKKLKM